MHIILIKPGSTSCKMLCDKRYECVKGNPFFDDKSEEAFAFANRWMHNHRGIYNYIYIYIYIYNNNIIIIYTSMCVTVRFNLATIDNNSNYRGIKIWCCSKNNPDTDWSKRKVCNPSKTETGFWHIFYEVAWQWQTTCCIKDWVLHRIIYYIYIILRFTKTHLILFLCIYIWLVRLAVIQIVT